MCPNYTLDFPHSFWQVPVLYFHLLKISCGNSSMQRPCVAVCVCAGKCCVTLESGAKVRDWSRLARTKPGDLAAAFSWETFPWVVEEFCRQPWERKLPEFVNDWTLVCPICVWIYIYTVCHTSVSYNKAWESVQLHTAIWIFLRLICRHSGGISWHISDFWLKNMNDDKRR